MREYNALMAVYVWMAFVTALTLHIVDQLVEYVSILSMEYVSIFEQITLSPHPLDL